MAFSCLPSAVVIPQSIDLWSVNFEWLGEYTWLAPLSMHVPSHDFRTWRASAMFAKLEVQVKANSSLSSSSAASSIVAVSPFLLFFLLRPWPSFLPPLYQQLTLLLWPGFLQLWHITPVSACCPLLLSWACPFPFSFLEQPMLACSEFLDLSSFMTWCCASSILQHIKKRLGKVFWTRSTIHQEWYEVVRLHLFCVKSSVTHQGASLLNYSDHLECETIGFQ